MINILEHKTEHSFSLQCSREKTKAQNNGYQILKITFTTN